MYKNLSLEKLWYTTCHAETFRRMERKCHYQSFWWSSSYYFTCKTCGIWCWWNLRHMVLMKLAAYGVDEIFLYYYYIDFYHQNRKQSVQVNNINSDLLSQASNKELKLGQFYLIISLITFFILLKLQMPTILPTTTH